MKPAPSEISVMGRRWDSSRPSFFAAPEGLSLEHVITTSIERAYREHQYSASQCRALLRYARCRLNGIEIDRSQWATTYPRAGARVEILHGVRGGGGGGIFGGGGGGGLGHAHLLHDLVHDLADQLVFHVFSLRTLFRF